jgi:hypothetical protein
MTNEEKAIQKILDAVSDIRLSTDYLAFYLKQAVGPTRARLDEVLEAAGYRKGGAQAPAEEDVLPQEASEPDEPGEPAERLWAKTINKILNQQEVTRAEITSLGMDLAMEYFDNESAYGEVEALSGRVAWEYEDGHVLWFDAETESIFLSHLTKEYKPNDINDILTGSRLPKEDFAWSYVSNGWEYASGENAWDVAEILEETFGKVQMYFPWEMAIESLQVEDGFDEFLSIAEIEIETPEQEELMRSVHSLFELLLYGAREETLKISGVEDYFAGTCSGDQLMPQYSSVGRFNAFLNELEEVHNWAMVYDECCGSCSRSSVEMVKAEEGKENSPVFITWGQNAHSSWNRSGAVDHMHLASDDEIKTIEQVASSHGLNVARDDKPANPDNTEWFIYIS